MTGALIAVACRSTVAAVFVLTAVWKLSNRREFSSSFARLAPGRLGGLASVAVWPLATFELTLSLVVLAGIRVSGLALIGPVAALALVGVFTLALARGGEGGCGCWFTPPGQTIRVVSLMPLLRNLVLLVMLGAAAVLSPHAVDGLAVTAGLAPFATGLVLAVLLVEAPHVAAVLTFSRRTGLGGAQ